MINYATEDEVYAQYKKDESKVVIYKNSVYDVSNFIAEHPGGPEKIEEYFGKNIEKPFAEEEHSKYALRVLLALPKIGEILDKDLQEKLEVEIDVAYKKSFCCSRDYVIKKLFTHEDPVYLHKSLGLFALVSFVYRYLYVFPKEGNLGFNGHWFDHLTLLLHMGLSTSALIFHVLPHRILKRPLVIWEEYRLHAIIFTLRCVSVYFFAIFYPFQNNGWDNVVQWIMVMAHHVVVDEITKRVGPGDMRMTTIRGKTEGGESSNAKTVPRQVLFFYAFFQLCALGTHLVPQQRLADLGYNVLAAIQTNAFLMTLFRKGIIRWYTHAFWYTVALVVGHIVMLGIYPNVLWFYSKMVVMAYLRFNLRMDKYVIWFFYAIVALPVVEQAIFQKFNEATQAAGASEYLHGLGF